MVRLDRLRRRLRLVSVLVLSLSSLAIATSDRPAERESGPTYSLDCLPFVEPDSVADINELIATYRSVPGFLGADVGADLLLQDGRRMWVFGDTLRHAEFKGQRLVRNSMLMFSPGCATVVMPADRGAVVPDRLDGVGYWPMDLAGVRRDGHDLVGLSLQRVLSTGPGLFDFAILGPAIAVFRVWRGEPPQLLYVRDLGRDSRDPARPMWGAALETVGDWVYIYGTSRPGGEPTLGTALSVARARLIEAADQAAWRYWDGRRWQRRPGRAAVLIPAAGGVSQVLSVFHRAGTWYAVSKRDDVFGTDLVIWKAPAPTGPFVPSEPLAELPSDSPDGLLRYLPLAHPDLLPRPDSVVVSYSRNVTDLERVIADPQLYRPRFLRVPLP